MHWYINTCTTNPADDTHIQIADLLLMEVDSQGVSTLRRMWAAHSWKTVVSLRQTFLFNDWQCHMNYLSLPGHATHISHLSHWYISLYSSDLLIVGFNWYNVMFVLTLTLVTSVHTSFVVLLLRMNCNSSCLNQCCAIVRYVTLSFLNWNNKVILSYLILSNFNLSFLIL